MQKALTEIQQRAWELISRARLGKEITGKQISRSIKLIPRSEFEGADMRSIIHALRLKNYPVCANSRGYYAAQNKKELDGYCNSLAGRIREMEDALAGLRGAQPVFMLQQQEPILTI